MNWIIADNPPFNEDLFTMRKTAAWETLKLALLPGTILTGTVYIQAPFGVFFDAGLGFPVLLSVTDFDKLAGGMQFPADYPPLGSCISGELWGFTDHNRQVRVGPVFTVIPTAPGLFGQAPDFQLTYRLFTAEEGGRRTPAYQGMRWDFRYETEAISTGTHLIHPEFLGPDGGVLPAGPLPLLGQANMFCLSPGPQAFHRQHIRPGVRGYFVEGSRRVGVCEVAEVLGLKARP